MTYEDVERLVGPPKGEFYLRMRRHAGKQFKNDDEITNVATEAAYRVLRNVKQDKVSFVSKWQVWVYANKALKHCVADEKARVRGLPHQLFEGEVSATVGPRPSTVAESKEALTEIGAALNQLSPRQRQVWNLREGKGLTFKEIAARLGIRASNARRDHVYAKRKLQLLLAPPREDLAMRKQELLNELRRIEREMRTK